MAEPKIYKKNYVSADDTITVSHSDATKSKLYDRDIDSKWITSGANNDATPTTVQVDFYEGTVAIQRTIDTLLLVNHNLKNWKYEYWDGSAWQSLYTNATDSSSTRLVSHTQVTTYKVKITCNGATQTVNAEKYIGEFYSTLLTCDIGQDFNTYNPNFRSMAKEVKLGDGSIHRTFVRSAPNRTSKYEASAVIKLITDAKLATLYSIHELGEPFLWYPESTQRPTEMWYVHWYNVWRAQYSVPNYKGAGWDLTMELKEV